jgi:ABC-type molybdate transport system substrate-binding protein
VLTAWGKIVKLTRLAVACIAAATVIAGCGGDDDESSDSSAEAANDSAVRTTEPLEALATSLVESYTAENPDSELAVTVDAVEPLDDAGVAILPAYMLANTGEDGTVIGRSLAVIVVAAGNPAQVAGVDAFGANSSLNSRACGPEIAYGNFAEAVVRLGGVEADPARLGTGCAAEAVDQVARGELDAALVFRPAVTLPDGVEVIDVPEEQNFVVDVAYALTGDDESAVGFADWLGSDAATQVLTEAGYLP